MVNSGILFDGVKKTKANTPLEHQPLQNKNFELREIILLLFWLLRILSAICPEYPLAPTRKPRTSW